MAPPKTTQLVWLLLFLAPLSGCSVWRYARLVGFEEPKQYCEQADDEASMATYRSWADQAWAERGANCPDGCTQADYSWGFREGFAQFVYAGGDGRPPATPPRPYWQLDLRSPEGAAAVQSWFEGYRLGARTAREGGYRDCATLRVSASLNDCDACRCPEREGHNSGSSQTPYGIEGPSFATPSSPAVEVVLPQPMIDEPADFLEGAPIEEAPELPAPEGVRSTTLIEPVPPLAGRAPTFQIDESSPVRSGAVQTAIFQIVR